MATKSTEVYRIKITLTGSEPPIWRCVLVPADITLAKLHDVVQIAMGWSDCHLHEFLIDGKRIGISDASDEETLDERKFRLNAELPGVGATARYLYDFGDDWDHTIRVEAVAPLNPAHAYPVCVGGELNCPPEDCGGLYGYYELLDALAKPKHREHKAMIEWIGAYDPKDFSVDEVNSRLKRLQGKRRSAR